MNRRGFTLVELLTAAVISGSLSVLVGGIVTHAFARLRDRSERTGMEQAIRASAGAVRALIEPLGRDSAAGSDVVSAAAGSVVVRAGRASGILCAVGSDHLVLRGGLLWWQASRAPVAGRDSLLVASGSGPDRWAAVALTGNATTAPCPDGSSGMRLPAVLPGHLAGSIGPGSPLRLFEPVEVRVYSSSGVDWIGVRLAATGESIQPLAGPLAGIASRLQYTGSGTAVVRVSLDLTAVTERAAGIGLARRSRNDPDSALVAIAIRGRP